MLAKDPDAKLLAGGHSLLPVMKLRLAKPTQLLDIGRIEGSNSIELKGRSIVIGAMARHVEVANSQDRARRRCRRWPSSPAMIGDPAVRHRGTIGGSLANNDPNADYPAAVLGPRRHDHHQQAPDRGRRFLQGHVRDRARARRDHHQGQLPARQEGGLPEVQAPGLGLCAGRRVRVASAAPTSAWR